MKILSFIVAMLIMLPSPPDGGRNYWDTLLDKYEALCNACKEKKSKKEIQQLSESLNEHLKHPEGKMTPVQKERFASIQNRYRGVITISDRTVPEVDPPRLIKVDTVRRYEHIHVTDTVFVKEIIGSIELNQYVHNKDTVYHIIQYQSPPAVEKPQQETPEPVILAIPATKQVTRIRRERPVRDTVFIHPTYILMAHTAIGGSLSYGATVGVVDKWGGYASFHSDFHNVAAGYSCTSDGMTGGSRIMTNGNTDHSRLAITAGACYEATKWLIAYAGVGYGRSSLFWQDIGGTWMDVSDISTQGAELEAGGIFHLGILGLSLGVSTTGFKYAEFKAGLGFTF